jgi:hypothetical protein
MKRAFCVSAWIAVGCARAWGQKPSDTESPELIEKSREKALAYTRSLPDFVCTEVVRRYRDSRPAVRGRIGGWMSTPAEIKWSPTDKLNVKLSYFQQREEHKLVLVNDRPTDQKYESLAGGIETGEFGGTLQSIFDPATATSFHWERWKNVRRHRTALYGYQVERAHSRYAVASGPPGDVHQGIVAFHGEMEVDRETGEVLHFTYAADDIPREVKLDLVSTAVDYDFADVGGRSYLLPAYCETEIHSAGMSVKNEIEFREYRKFSADSSIEFGVAK